MEKKLTLRDKIDRWIFIHSVRFSYWKLVTGCRIRRWLHCRKGYHKLRPQYLKVSTKKPGKKEVCIYHGNWFECIVCGRLVFTSKKERDKYLRYKAREEKENKKMAKRMVKNYFKE